jgi:hypothetical protein
MPRTRRASVALFVCCAGSSIASTCSRAEAQSSYFAATGTFTHFSGEAHNFNFNLPATSDMLFRTWSHGGGTNAAGQTIPPGGIDSVLTLYTSAGGFIETNDDIGPGQKDSQIIEPSLGPGNFRLELTNFKNAVNNGAWAVDLVNNSGSITMNSISGSTNSVMHTLAFGGEDGGVATLPINSATSPTIFTSLQLGEGAAVQITGSGTVTFAAPVTGLGGISGSAFKRFNANASGGGLATDGSSHIVASVTMTADFVREGALQIDGTVQINPNATIDATSRVDELTLSGSSGNWTGELALANNAIVIDYDAASPLATVIDQVRFGSISGSGGILSGLGAGYDVGYAEASSFASVPPIFGTVDSTAVLVRGTRLGDANLDGEVNLQDFNRLASNFGLSSGATWTQGDFNHDGVVNLQDFNRLAANFGLTATGPEVTSEDWAALSRVVPEPTSLLLVGVPASAGMLTRARRRTRSSTRWRTR